MLLEIQDLIKFFTLHQELMFFVSQRLKLLSDDVESAEEFSELSPEVRLRVRDAFLAHPDLIQAFVEENPARLAAPSLEIIQSWRYLVQGSFYVFREMKKHTVFLSSERPAIAYGVVALSQPLEELLGPKLPVLVITVLLPFEGRIVYDGLMSSKNITFGPGIRRMLDQSFKDAKSLRGIVTTLPLSETRRTPKPRKVRPAPQPPSNEEKDEVTRSIIGLLDEFCARHLNEEYAALCRKLAEKLGRKRPSPMLKGRPNAWASAIARAIGGVNFLHDKTQKPYMRSTDIDHHLGASTSDAATKLAAIRKMFGMRQLDPNWSLPSRLERNPLAWMIKVNGFNVDARHAPKEVQEIAFEKGLIPYIPTDRGQGV